MDWEQQDEFLQRWPELHSLLAAYIAVEDGEVNDAIRAFIAENTPAVVAITQQQLTELLNSNNQTWWCSALQLASAEHEHQAWLADINAELEKI